MHLAPRERLLASSFELFSQYGFHATGVDTILSHSKVAKATLYRHFPSKEALIVAVLEKRSAELHKAVAQVIDRSKLNAEEKVYRLFDYYKERIRAESYIGCIFIKATLEYGKASSPVHCAAVAHKQAMAEYIHTLVSDCVDVDESPLSMQLLVLLNGATVSAQIHKDSNSFEAAKAVARRLLRHCM